MQTSTASEAALFPSGEASASLGRRRIVLCGAPRGLPVRWSRMRPALDVHQISSFSVEEEERVAAFGPECALLSAADPAGLELCCALRLSIALRSLPIIALVEDPWSDEPGRALRVGADDFLPHSRLDSLPRKLGAARAAGTSVVAPVTGKVLLADPDPSRRAQLGRQLQRLGLQVVFAVDLAYDLGDRELRLVVAHADLLPAELQAGFERLLGPGGSSLPWIVSGEGNTLRQLARSVVTPQVAFFDLDNDPSQVAFLANRLLHREPAIPRSSERLPFERPVYVNPRNGATFWGFTYNLSAGGLYVRTLTPPPVGVEISLELQPPHGAGRVVVGGVTVWRQPFCGAQGYPPGFGVRYTSLALADAAALQAGYQKLLDDQGDLLR